MLVWKWDREFEFSSLQRRVERTRPGAMPNSAGLRGSGYAANRTVRAPADGHIPADALDTGVRVSEVWFADATERRSANWGISEDMRLALIGTGWRDLSRRPGLRDWSLEEDGFELAVPPRRERLWGATPGKHRRLGPEPVSGSAFRAAVRRCRRNSGRDRIDELRLLRRQCVR